ncbi:MAG TPA: type II secretion system F family protein [Acidimicrobiales bacterium]|nr:type II secretion system F family protein [Acidimicrobiales bacterium]
MIVLALLGAGAGLACWKAVRAAWPRPVGLDVLVARLERPGTAATAAGTPAVPPLQRLGLRVVRLAGLAPEPDAARARALAAAGRSAERHALDRVVGALGLAGCVVLAATGLSLVGVAPPAGLVLVGVVGAAVGGYFLPEAELAKAAERRRRSFRHALSGYLDLVSVVLAGGGGIETALHSAAEAGDGWAFASIRQALDRARLTGRTPWDTLAALGAELGVGELGELAAAVALAGAQGARIRSSLAAKADALRGHQVAEAEAAAEAATERMTVPTAVLLFGFLVFVAYPALRIITATGAHRLS